jgi:hypothetical protein
MPDLNLIKQEEQGARPVCQGSLRQPRRRLRGWRDHVNRPARLLRQPGRGLDPAPSRLIGARRRPGGLPASSSRPPQAGGERQGARVALLAPIRLC